MQRICGVEVYHYPFGEAWTVSFSTLQNDVSQVANVINEYCQKYKTIPVSVSIAFNTKALAGEILVAAVVKKAS